MRTYALIYVRSAVGRNRRRLPTVVKDGFNARQLWGLRQGDIYFRRGDETVRLSSQEELEDLMDSMEARADQAELEASSRSEAAFAISSGTYRLLERGYDSYIGRAQLREDLRNAILGDPRIWIINVHGPGGVGKSALVTEVAYEFFSFNQFESIIQLTAKETVLTQEGIRRATGRSLYSLENLLDHIAVVFEETPPDTIDQKRELAIELLSSWKTLLILDNMETVQDGRILRFVQSLPADTRTKVVLTSRQRTAGWEYSIDVPELSEQEVADFVDQKASSFHVELPSAPEVSRKISQASGGLPLAVEWILGRYAKTGDLSDAVVDVAKIDSPILEFSFRNIWNVLGPAAQAVLVVLTIFDSPPDMQDLAIALGWQYERIEGALEELKLVTLVRETTQESDGRVTFSCLPITLSFAAQQSSDFGTLETDSRRRTQHFSQQMELREYEINRFATLFSRYQIKGDNEKRAVILVRRGESASFAGRTDEAATLFKQARELAPLSGYVFAMSANFELNQHRVGLALRYANKACELANDATGALCYSVKARVLDTQRDKEGRVLALHRALEYDPEDVVLRHQYGVALSLSGRTQQAIAEFSRIIDSESTRVPPSETLIMAYKTRIINYRRMREMQLAAQDLAAAEALLSDYPHLQGQAYHIAELRDH
jgi:tetratricopeptide (TPR) repeat protein